MSEEEIKIGIRGKIKQLQNCSNEEIYNYFKFRNIKPDEFEEDYIFFEPKKNQFTPMINNKNVFVDYLFVCDYVYNYESFKINKKELDMKIEEMKNLFNIENEDIHIFSYIWYNGTDEPFYIEW